MCTLIKDYCTFVSHPVDGQISTKKLKDYFKCTNFCEKGDSVCCWIQFYFTIQENQDYDTFFMRQHLPSFNPIINEIDEILRQRQLSSWIMEMNPSIEFLKNNRTANLSTIARISHFNKMFSISVGLTSEMECIEIIKNVIIVMSDHHKHIVYNCVAFDVEKNNEMLAKLHFGDGHSYYFEINFVQAPFILNNAIVKFFDMFRNSSGFTLVGHNVSNDVTLCESVLKTESNEPFKFPDFLDTSLLWCRFGGWGLDGFGLQIMQTYITGGTMLKKRKLSSNVDWSKSWNTLPFYFTLYNISDLKAIYNLYLSFFIVNFPRMFPSKSDFDNSHLDYSIPISHIPKMFYQVIVRACKNQAMNYSAYQKEHIIANRRFAAEYKEHSVFYKRFCLFWNDKAICINKKGWKVSHRTNLIKRFLSLYTFIQENK